MSQFKLNQSLSAHKEIEEVLWCNKDEESNNETALKLSEINCKLDPNNVFQPIFLKSVTKQKMNVITYYIFK